MQDVMYKFSEFTIAQIVDYVDKNLVALPEIQRPFVWEATKVRDLFDSLYKGMPIGIFILWEVSEDTKLKSIGEKSETPKYAIIDGQQRITSLYSVIKGKEIINRNFKKVKMKIAFNPLEEKFEVLDAAIEKDFRWIKDITEIFSNNASYNFVNNFLENLRKNGATFDENSVANAIQKVNNIKNLQIQTIEISPQVDLDEVSEIFVRINSKGKELNQSDFILTIMSVYWDEGRKEIEDFCKRAREHPSSKDPSPFNIIKLEPTPEQIVRAEIGYGFQRGRLKYVHLALKGKDLDTYEESEELRNKNFNILKDAQKVVLDLTNFHDFISEIASIGFVNANMITSKTAFFIAYTIYLLLKKLKLDKEKAIHFARKWFVFSLLTQRYSGSPESTIEKDLSFFKSNEEGVLESLNEIINSELTEDFFSATLPSNLDTSLTISPFYIVYIASLVYNDAPVMFSDKKIKDYLSPFVNYNKKPLDVHHIFPKDYLKKQGITEKKKINQVANLVYLEYGKNIKIGEKSPQEYWPQLIQGYSEEEIENIYKTYSIPKDFPNMPYEDFLKERRKLMAMAIKDYFNKI